MTKWAVFGKVVGSKYIGSYEAETAEEAIELAQKDAYVSLCHQCSGECEDPEVDEMVAEVDWVKE